MGSEPSGGPCSALHSGGSRGAPRRAGGKGEKTDPAPHTPASRLRLEQSRVPGAGYPPLARRCFSHASVSKALHASMGLSRWAFGGTPVALPGAHGSWRSFSPGSTCPAGSKPGLLVSKLSCSACGPVCPLGSGAVRESLFDLASRQMGS